MPMVFHAMPEAFQLMIVRKHLPAAPEWTLQPQVDGIVPTLVGCTIAQAEEVGGRVRLGLERLDGGRTVVMADHVIAGTGIGWICGGWRSFRPRCRSGWTA